MRRLPHETISLVVKRGSWTETDPSQTERSWARKAVGNARSKEEGRVLADPLLSASVATGFRKGFEPNLIPNRGGRMNVPRRGAI